MTDFQQMAAACKAKGVLPAHLMRKAGLNPSTWTRWKAGGGINKASWDAAVKALSEMEGVGS